MGEMQKTQQLKRLSERIQELGHKSSLLLLFLSFAMVSVATLENVNSEAMKPLLQH